MADQQSLPLDREIEAASPDSSRSRKARSEVVFIDVERRVAARRWCWRQSADSATSPSTTEALIVTEALHDTASASVTSALEDLLDLRRHEPEATIQALT